MGLWKEVLWSVRSFIDQEGVVEIMTPCLPHHVPFHFKAQPTDEFWSPLLSKMITVRYNKTAILTTDQPLSWKLACLVTLLRDLLDKKYHRAHWNCCLYPQTKELSITYWSLAVSSFFPEPCSASHSSPSLFFDSGSAALAIIKLSVLLPWVLGFQRKLLR